MRQPLITIDAGDDSTLILYEEGGKLWFQRELRAAGGEDAPARVPRPERGEPSQPESVSGLLGVFPVMVRGRMHAVAAGAALTGVDSVVLTFAARDPDHAAAYQSWERRYPMVERTGRRVWMSHPFPFYIGMPLAVRWMQGADALAEDRVTLDSGGVSYIR